MGNQRTTGRPDNNRRLALLERRVVVLGAALKTASIEPAAGEDVFDAAIRAIGSIEAEKRLTEEVAVNSNAEVTADVITFLAEVGLEPGEDHVRALLVYAQDVTGEAVQLRAEAEEGGVTRIALLEAELAAANRSLIAQKGAATRARNEAAVLRLDRSPSPRPIGRPQGRFGKAGEPFDRALARFAIDAGDVEIVFSDGKAEIVELEPVSVGGDAWLRGVRGYALRPVIDLEPGAMDMPEVAIAGFGLVANGEQIDWQELPEPIVVRRNARVRLENTILF